MQRRAVVFGQKKAERNDSAHHLTDHRGGSGSDQPPFKKIDKEKVQKHIGHPGRNRNDQTQLRTLCCYEEALEGILKHKGRVSDEKHPGIHHAVLQKVFLSADQ